MIYDILEHAQKQLEQGDFIELSAHFSEINLDGAKGLKSHSLEEKGQLFSTIAARLFFFILLLTDIVWGLYSSGFFILTLLSNLITGFKISRLKQLLSRRFLNLKRAGICAIALFVALFSPTLGTIIACSYFLVYDKKGVQEIVPAVLQDQFHEFLNPLQQGLHPGK